MNRPLRHMPERKLIACDGKAWWTRAVKAINAFVACVQDRGQP